MNNNEKFIGQVLKVICDESYEDYSVCRTYTQCPQIDTIIYVNEKLEVGNFYNIKITNKSDYDLEGERYEFT